MDPHCAPRKQHGRDSRVVFDVYPLELIDRREDEMGYGAWLGMPDKTNNPFILVIAQFYPDKDPFANAPIATLAPFAHLGMELPTKEDCRSHRRAGQARRLSRHAANIDAAAIGFVTMLRDPDGNMVEFSWDQGVFSTLQERWNTPA